MVAERLAETKGETGQKNRLLSRTIFCDESYRQEHTSKKKAAKESLRQQKEIKDKEKRFFPSTTVFGDREGGSN